MSNREKRCNKGLHEWVSAEVYNTFKYGIIVTDNPKPKCRVCGKELEPTK